MRRELGHLEGLLIVLLLRAMATIRLGQSTEALALTREALDIARQLNSTWFFTAALPIFASLAAEQQPQRAARLGGAVTAMSESAQTLPIPITEALFTKACGSLSVSSGSGIWRSLGRGPSHVDGQRAGRRAGGRGAPRKDSPARLTPTEVEVLRRLSRGHTTRQIAAELVVAVSTIDRHITHIYEKIGRRGRSAATAFAVENGLT